jgi:flagellar protein FliO/FliZ
MNEADLLRLFLGLVLVVGLILAFGWLARRSGLQGRAQGNMRVVDTLALGPRQRIVILEVDKTWLVVGVTAGQMSVLHTLPAGDTPASQPIASAFAGKLGQALRRR